MKFMKSFWLFQTTSAGLSRGKSAFFWLWNVGLVLASAICLGGVSLLFAYGSYDPNLFYSYFDFPLILLLNLAPVVGLVFGVAFLKEKCTAFQVVCTKAMSTMLWHITQSSFSSQRVPLSI